LAADGSNVKTRRGRAGLQGLSFDASRKQPVRRPAQILSGTIKLKIFVTPEKSFILLIELDA
jgi:hypothetical protein